jgi:hypothetical protein
MELPSMSLPVVLLDQTLIIVKSFWLLTGFGIFALAGIGATRQSWSPRFCITLVSLPALFLHIFQIIIYGLFSSDTGALLVFFPMCALGSLYSGLIFSWFPFWVAVVAIRMYVAKRPASPWNKRHLALLLVIFVTYPLTQELAKHPPSDNMPTGQGNHSAVGG